MSPSAALEEAERLPAGFLVEIIEVRHYAEAKAMVDRATSAAEMPKTPLCQLVQEIEAGIVLKAMQAAKDACQP